MNRRVFLRGIGGASLAAPFLPSIYEKAAKAQGTTPPRRPSACSSTSRTTGA